MVNLLADQGFGGEPFFVSDMDRCMPGSALSRDPLRRHWRLMDYEAEGLSGTMLTAGPETAAPEITCPLGISGHHAISIGTYVRHGLLNVPVSVLARLSGDEQFSLLSMPPQEERGAIVHELFWKVADLTGQDIVIGQAKNRVAPRRGPWFVPVYERKGGICQVGAPLRPRGGCTGGRPPTQGHPPSLCPQRRLVANVRLQANDA